MIRYAYLTAELTELREKTHDAWCKLHPNARQAGREYATQVLIGNRRLSGADLKGTAKRYGAHYAAIRDSVTSIWTHLGGSVIRLRRGGRVMLALVGPDQLHGTTTCGWAIVRQDPTARWEFAE